MSSYFVAFSNDSRDWKTLHDGYAEWVSGQVHMVHVVHMVHMVHVVSEKALTLLTDTSPLSSPSSPAVVLRERGQGHAGAGPVLAARGGALHPHPAAELERQLVPPSRSPGLPAPQSVYSDGFLPPHRRSSSSASKRPGSTCRSSLPAT